MSKTFLSRYGLVIRFLGLITTFAIVFSIVDFHSVILVASDLPAWLMVSVVSLNIIKLFITALRWRILAGDFAKNASLWQFFKWTMASSGCNLLVPGIVGSDLSRSAMVALYTSRKGTNIIVVLLDRFLGLFSILLLAFISILFSFSLGDRLTYLVVIGSVLLFGVSAFFLIFHSRFKDGISRLSAGNPLLKRFAGTGLLSVNEFLGYFAVNKKRVAVAFLICLPIHGIWFTIMYLLSLSGAVGLSFLSIVMVVSITWLAVAMPISFMGLGVSELSFIYLMSLHGVSSEIAVALSLQGFCVNFVTNIIGLCFLYSLKKKNQDSHKKRENSTAEHLSSKVA